MGDCLAIEILPREPQIEVQDPEPRWILIGRDYAEGLPLIPAPYRGAGLGVCTRRAPLRSRPRSRQSAAPRVVHKDPVVAAEGLAHALSQGVDLVGCTCTTPLLRRFRQLRAGGEGSLRLKIFARP